jgi:hypothetical protein
MGSLFTTSAKPEVTKHEEGFIYNVHLNDSTIKELRSMRDKLETTWEQRGYSKGEVYAELAPLYEEIAKRESMDIVQ